ncbi:MAG: alpha/beta hydrolase [Bryobacterales bacterium]|nr:alpha/beta hydrolase [Bryobacterales bacterium]
MTAASLHTERIPAARENPTLVFLHHGLGSIAQWRDFPAQLCAATSLPAFLYDRCGHGRSPACGQPRTPAYMHREAETLHRLLTHHNIGDCILIGHSDGASIALLYAALPNVPAPRLIVSESAHVFVEPITRHGIRLTIDAYLAGMREKLRKYHGANTEALFWDWAGTWLAPSFDSWNLCRTIGNVSCPVAAIQGAEDEYGTESQLDAILRSVPCAAGRFLIPQAAHEPHHQSRPQTLDTMARLIARYV